MGSTFQFGLVCFVLFFGLSQFFQWTKHLTLPLPIFILGGAFLAIASNFNKRAGLPFSLLDELSHQSSDPSSEPIAPTASPELTPSSKPIVQPPQVSKPVSFTIRKPE